ncbi:uromodulin-like [Protopterus annectens]|uniref:uromodulin-like n=1 Tax=Protopterus annectens TaxID=7888 RepID=UPI001CFBC66A|nr:uromodulin-like [Protopterus annectens]
MAIRLPGHVNVLLLIFISLWQVHATAQDASKLYVSSLAQVRSSCDKEIESPSLTYLVDTTGSMSDDIKQLKLVNRQFLDQVVAKFPCRVRDYTMVEFNDPEVGPSRSTKSKDEFAMFFDKINPNGGGDCPELFLQGLKLALEMSPQHSFILVLTDASAKDYSNVDLQRSVDSLIEEKKPRVFVLATGLCESKDSPEFAIYRHLAEKTSGHVLQIGVADIGKVFRYLEKILIRPVDSTQQLLSKIYDFKGTHTEPFTIDNHLTSLMISTDGPVTHIGLISPEATEIPTKKLLSESWGSVYTADRPLKGEWSLNITAEGPHSVTLEGFIGGTQCSGCPANAECKADCKYDCKEGFDDDGMACTDIDECSNENLNSCRLGTCVNTVGSYKCLCPSGYAEDFPGAGCKDIDECSQPELNHCHLAAVCTNSEGNYSCSCQYGYTGDGYRCEKNECILSAPCDAYKECIKVPGSYICSDPCENYTVLNESWRSINVPYDASEPVKCDNMKRGWYRFEGHGGQQMPEHCIKEYNCGTVAPVWLNGSHPSSKEEIAIRKTCVSQKLDCCSFSNNIKVKACTNGYYVYKLEGIESCPHSYCTDPRFSTNPCASLSCADDEECKNLNGVWGCHCKTDHSSSLNTDTDGLNPVVTCSTSTIKASLNKCQLEKMGYNTSAVTLMDRKCAAIKDEGEGQSISFITLTRNGYCGTRLMKNATHAIYQNVLQLWPKSTGAINAKKETNVSYNCTYFLDMQTSLALAENPVVSSNNLTAGSSSIYKGKIALYRDSAFTTPYEGTVAILNESMLHVGLMVEDVKESGLVLLVKDCYATMTPSDSDLDRVFIIKDGCPAANVTTAVINGIRLQSQFSVQHIVVSNLGQVYLHCEISLCINSSGECMPDCLGFRSSHMKHTINAKKLTVGPISSIGWKESCMVHLVLPLVLHQLL